MLSSAKDHRDDRPQTTVGLAVTNEGIPVRAWSFSGNASDQTIVRQVHDELGDWKLHRMLWIGDRGFSSQENRSSLQRRGGRLVIDKRKVRAEEHLDGKFLLSSSDDHIEASEMARLYKSLLEVEEAWRDLKQVLELRPVYHRKEERIRAHVTLCFLALMLVRVVERATGDTWRNVRRELESMHLGEFVGAAGRVVQRTETTRRQREVFKALDIAEPPLVHEIDAASKPRRRAKRPA